MKLEARYPLQVGVTLLIVVGLSWYPLARYATRDTILAIGAGTALSVVNAFVGFLAIEYSFDKSYTVFLRTVFGGMGLRLAGMLCTMVALLLIAGIEAVPFAVTVLSLYLIFLVLEILFIQRKVLVKNQGNL